MLKHKKLKINNKYSIRQINEILFLSLFESQI